MNNYFYYQHKLQKIPYKVEPYLHSDEVNDIKFSNMYEYCSQGDNLLTEDVCYNWYVNSVYPDTKEYDSDYSISLSNTSNVKAIMYKNGEQVSSLMKNKCIEYPWNQKCNCMSDIKDNLQRTFEFKNTQNLAQTYHVSCLYPNCSNNNKSYDFANSSAYLPYEIANGDYSCPENLCSILINKSTISLDNGSELNLKNICHTTKTTEGTSTNSSIFTVFTDKIDEFAVKLNVSSTIIYIVIGLIIFIVLLLIIIAIKSINKSNDKQNFLQKAMMIKKLKKMKN